MMNLVCIKPWLHVQFIACIAHVSIHSTEKKIKDTQEEKTETHVSLF